MKTLLRPTVVVVTLVECILSLLLIFYFIEQTANPSGARASRGGEDSERPLVANATGVSTLRTGQPVRLTIPGINVDAAIAHVGLTSDGAMDVPTDPDEVAWYANGQRPGEEGSAVFAGHYDRKNGLPAVFSDLHTLRPGDKLSVKDEQGVATSFVVRTIRRYDPAADATEVFGSNDGTAHLNLITCEGVWNTAQNSYSHRLVIFTDKEYSSK